MPKKDDTQTPAKSIDKFVQRHLKGGESVTALAAEFGVSRATGYIWVRRYRDGVVEQRLRSPKAPGAKPDKLNLSAENAQLARENAKLRTMVVDLLLKR